MQASGDMTSGEEILCTTHGVEERTLVGDGEVAVFRLGGRGRARNTVLDSGRAAAEAPAPRASSLPP